jgi:nitroimidazol reductase NimA-like FMN-containing flavoprotein (pyridoxamine 5'-phosphate oxidase superfamily)
MERVMMWLQQPLIGRDDVDALLRGEEVLRLVITDGGAPRVLPVSYGYDGVCLYCHCGGDVRDVEALLRNPHICFEVDAVCPGAPTADSELPPCPGIMGEGVATILTDPAQKRAALVIIVGQRGLVAGVQEFPAPSVERTTVIRIDIERMTCKQNGWKNQ